MTIFLKNIGLVLLCLFVLSAADAQETADSTPANCNCGVWVNAGFLSHHIQNDMPRNDENSGFGVEIPINHLLSLTAGQYYNSEWHTSHYLGMYVMPVSVGSFKLGAAFGGFDGYMHFNDGAWFPAIVPAVEYEGQRWGLNVVYIPSLSDRIQSVLSFQIKYRFEP